MPGRPWSPEELAELAAAAGRYGAISRLADKWQRSRSSLNAKLLVLRTRRSAADAGKTTAPGFGKRALTHTVVGL